MAQTRSLPVRSGTSVEWREVRCAFCLNREALENMAPSPDGMTQGFYDHAHPACIREAIAAGAVTFQEVSHAR